MPEPDVYALDGPRAVELMHERGIPLDRLKAAGAARFDDVWAEARRLVDLQGNTKRSRTRILIAPGLHDTQYVLGMADEFRRHSVAVNALWPRTVIVTAAARNLLGGDNGGTMFLRTFSHLISLGR